jgi:hypothetical protein
MERIFAFDLKEAAPAQGINDLGTLTNVIVRNAFTIAGVVAFILLIFGGFQFIVAAGSGDSKQMEKGKQAITMAIVGLAVVVASIWIVQIIETITGLNLLK